MRRRLLRIVVLAALLAPGLWIRSEPPPPNASQSLTLTPIAAAKGIINSEVEVLGGWRLTSPNSKFGGYSSLVLLKPGTALSASDSGEMLRFALPQGEAEAGAASQDATLARLDPNPNTDKYLSDVESLTRNPATEQIWAGYEGANAIRRFDRELNPQAKATPKAMQNWYSNSGPEAMTRLKDGRFLVIAEAASTRFGDKHPALLFPSDPTTPPSKAKSAKPVIFSYRPPEGFRPVDAAALDDGRALILLRRIRFTPLPEFHSALALAEPSEIKAGAVWQGRLIARLTAPVPPENYEGMAIEPRSEGRYVIWLISDDNHALYQDTILLKMRWKPAP